MIHDCPACGQKNRVPEQYTGIPVCARCKTQLFPTVMRLKDEEPPTSSKTRKRSRDRWLIVPILLLAFVIYRALNHDWSWLWDKTIDWITTVSVNLTIITALALAWLIIVIAVKVGWEEWRTTNAVSEDDEPLLDIGPWDIAKDYIHLIRQRFTLRKGAK